MNNKFENIPNDEDTTIILSQITKIGGYDAVLQFWLWDGINGQSAIFLEEQLKACDDIEVLKIMQSNGIEIKANHTIKRHTDGFAFLNYNFTVD